MSDLHKRLDAEYTQALLGNYSADYATWLEERIAALEALEAENKRLLEELDQVIAWHEGDDCPHARLEAPACVYYHYPAPGHEDPRCPRCATRRKLRAALAAAGYGEDE